MAVQAPKTVGPNLAAMTMRERAALAYEDRKRRDLHTAQRVTRNLAALILGVPHVEFDDFIPESFATRHTYEPSECVTFEVEGLEFNYVNSKKHGEILQTIDRCPECDDGVRLLYYIKTLESVAAFDVLLANGYFDSKRCIDCRKQEEGPEA